MPGELAGLERNPNLKHGWIEPWNAQHIVDGYHLKQNYMRLVASKKSSGSEEAKVAFCEWLSTEGFWYDWAPSSSLPETRIEPRHLSVVVRVHDS